MGVADTWRGVTDSVTDIMEIVNTIYSDVKDLCDQVGVTNIGERTLKESLSGV